MIIEYLFLDKSNRDNLDNYEYHYDVKSKGETTRTIVAQKNICDFDSSDRWTIKFELKGDNEENAKHLSIINDNIVSKYKPIVLINQSAAYYNKLLYPLINEFERKLRKLLYIRASMSSNEKAKKVLEDLYSLTFEAIYELLFTDDNFNKLIKEAWRNNGKKISKAEYAKVISSFDEKVLWDDLILSNTLAPIKDNFLKIKEYRNDVMHAHNFNKEKYSEIKKMYENVNKLLDTAIDGEYKYIVKSDENDTVIGLLADKIRSSFEKFVEPINNAWLEVLSNVIEKSVCEIIPQNANNRLYDTIPKDCNPLVTLTIEEYNKLKDEEEKDNNGNE